MTLPTGLIVLPTENDRRFPELVRKLRLLALRDLLQRGPEGLSEPVRRALPAVQALLFSSARKRSPETLEAIGSDDVLPCVLAMLAGVADPDAMLRAAVPPLLAQLAGRRGAIEESVLWDVPFSVLMVPGRGRARFDPPALGLVANASGVEVRLADGTDKTVETRLDALDVEPVLHAIPGFSGHLSLHDANPLSMLEEHPDKHGNAIDLGGKSIDDWTRAFGEALALVQLALPTVHAELGLAMRRLVPVGYEPERHLSASYREAPGLVYATLHPSVLTLAEAIVHETQHGKLNVLSFFDPSLKNGRTTWTPSPVRPDLRPLSGVLLAVHAFVPVAALHLRLAALDHPISRTPEFVTRRQQVLAGNERGMKIVHDLGEPTAIGKQLLADLDTLHALTKAAMPDAKADAEALPPG